jgi:predicted PurR-regulated permease PerM
MIASFYEIGVSAGCNLYNEFFVNYFAYGYYLIETGILPITISTFFSILAYQNVRRIVRLQIAIRRRKLDQQLTAMILARVAFFVVIILPYVLQRIYMLIVTMNKNDLIHNAIVQLFDAITSSLFYVNTAVCLINR